MKGAVSASPNNFAKQAILPNGPEHKHAEGKAKKSMNQKKGDSPSDSAIVTNLAERRSGSSEESGSESNAGSGSQSADNSGGSAESENGSQVDANTSPPVVNTEAETGVREEADVVDGNIEITSDDTMVMTSGFKRRAIIPETRVVVGDIKAFPEIYRTFQFHQFDWMNNAPGEYSSHLTKEFYSSYAATLMNFPAETVTTKPGKKYIAITWGPLNSIIVRGKPIDISETTINRMLHGT
uniref:Integrase core domain containing protein n=1 Tax=Solanum tuberosum TaxID=4113 RepID=M1DI74_SOLTU